MPRIFYSFFLLFLLGGPCAAQTPELGPQSQISLLTAGPGDVLYSKFGHSAVRVTDPERGIDVVYNYGTFDFNKENFYLKFAQGKLEYTLSRYPYSYFLQEYQYEQRWVTEQVLDLDVNERNRLFQLLETNYLPENREYLYDPVFDNCATRIWTIFEKGLKGLVFDPDFVSEQKTIRQLVNDCIPSNDWGTVGINVAWGAVVDRKATPKEHLFLPDYLKTQVANAQLHGKPLLQAENDPIEDRFVRKQTSFLLSPLFFFLLFLGLTLYITYRDIRSGMVTRWLDTFLLGFTGLAGLVLFLLWFATDHTATKYNYNLLWAFPFNLVALFIRHKNGLLRHGFRIYLWAVIFLMVLLLVMWLANIQYFSPILIPLLAALAVRYVFLIFRGQWETKQ